MDEISFNQLSKFSEWPKRLLGLEFFPDKIKTKKEIIREFEKENWGGLDNLSETQVSINIDLVEDKYIPMSEINPFFYEGKFFIASNQEILDKHLEVYSKVLAKYIKNSTALIEFGAGFGSKIIRLSQLEEFQNIPKYAAELTSSGQNLIRKISKQMNIDINVGKIDLHEFSISGIEIPKGGLIFTSYAAHYDSKMDKKFAEFLYSFRPYAVVNFEPCFELYPQDSIHGEMCKKYILKNGYTKNIWSVVNQFCSDHNLKLEFQRNIIGWNPFMPISILEWKKN